MPLQDFLGDTPLPPAIPKSKNWADCDEDDDFIYTAHPKEPVVLPTAPRAARDQCINEENIPTNPPFVAYISNLPYDIDEEDLLDFFEDMKVAHIRLPKEGNKFKGYGYVEFEDRQSLIEALSMIDTNLKTRRVRIELSNSNDDRRGRMGRMGDARREYSPERMAGDWRSARAGGDDGPPREDREDRDGDRGGYRSWGSDRRDDRRDDMRIERDSGFEDNKPGSWRDKPREPLPDNPRPSFTNSRPGLDDRDRMGSRFSDRGGPRGMRDGSRERDGERGGGSSFGPRRTYNDDPGRERDRWTNIRSQPREPLERDLPSSDSAPMIRPKLELKKRSIPVEAEAKSDAGSTGEGESTSAASAPTPASAPPMNIFGAAKPVDTAAREREIEERLARSAEDRAKEQGDSDKRRDGTWGRRNGENRYDQDNRSRPTWRSRTVEHDNRDDRDQNPRERGASKDSRELRGDRSTSRGSSTSSHCAAPLPSAEPSEKVSQPLPVAAKIENKKVELTEEEEISRMPKAKDDQAPNFIASNKYSMLPDDVDPDNVEE